MAATKQKRRYPIDTAYSYDGNAARKLKRWDEQETVRKQAPARKKHPYTREPGKVSLLAVCGFVMIGLLTILALSYNAKLVVVNDTVVGLREELSALQEEETKLLTQYELAYDLQAIEEKVLSSGLMVKVQSNQICMLELAEPDTVEYHKTAGMTDQMISGIKDFFSGVMAYF